MDTVIAAFHLHPIIDHFTIALLVFGVAAQVTASMLEVIRREGRGRIRALQTRLWDVSLILIIAGAAAAICSYFTGDAEADRWWDAMSPQAQQILAASTGTERCCSRSSMA